MPERSEWKKQKEIYWAHQAALRLNEHWELCPREAPDFCVTSSSKKFGLEVSECHIGPQNRSGSERRAAEEENRKALNRVRQEYESATGRYLNLKYMGPVNCIAMDELLQKLQETSLDPLENSTGSVEIILPSGKAFVHCTKNPLWIVVRDRVGWVSSNGKFLQREIDRKARKLATYRKAHPDVRLLLVANRTHNSGKLLLEEGFRPDMKGFNAVYFFSYPDDVTSFYS